jgi:hypothetical protein
LLCFGLNVVYGLKQKVVVVSCAVHPSECNYKAPPCPQPTQVLCALSHPKFYNQALNVNV